MDIVQHISELLYDHDCVIVPDFGGFVSSYQPASIHPVQHQFHPPFKNILFNEALKSNDGLLANHIAVQNKISYESAMTEISDFVNGLRQKLNTGESVLFQNIGMLSPDSNGIINFEQEGRTNYLKDVYGMSSFVSPAIRRDVQRAARVVKPVFAEEKKIQRQNQNAGMIVKIAASVVVVVMLAIAGYSYFQGTPAEPQESNLLTSINELVDRSVDKNNTPAVKEDLGTSTSTIESSSERNAEQSMNNPAVEKNDGENEIAATTSAENPATVNEQPIEKVTATPETASQVPAQKMYHLIAGSFLDADNTGPMIDQYVANGYSPTVLGPSDNGYFRVSIAAYIRKSQALAELQKAREKYNPNIWLLRR